MLGRVSLNEVAGLLNDSLGTNQDPIYGEGRSRDVRDSQVDVSFSRDQTGFELLANFKAELQSGFAQDSRVAPRPEGSGDRRQIVPAMLAAGFHANRACASFAYRALVNCRSWLSLAGLIREDRASPPHPLRAGCAWVPAAVG